MRNWLSLLSVHLPDPFGPSRPKTAPDATVKDRSSRASVDPYDLVNPSTVKSAVTSSSYGKNLCPQKDCTEKSRNATTEETEITEVRRSESRDFRRKCSAILLLLISVFSVFSVVKLFFAVQSQKSQEPASNCARISSGVPVRRCTLTPRMDR